MKKGVRLDVAKILLRELFLQVITVAFIENIFITSRFNSNYQSLTTNQSFQKYTAYLCRLSRKVTNKRELCKGKPVFLC